MCVIMAIYLIGILMGNFHFSWWYTLAAFIADVVWIAVAKEGVGGISLYDGTSKRK